MIDDREQNILERALKALERTAGIHGRVVDGQADRADTIVEIEANGQRHPYVAQIKRVDRFAILRDIKNLHAPYGQAPQPLLVAPRLTAETAEKCRELDLQFIDATGNAYLRGPGLYVLVKGQRPIEGDDHLLIGHEAKRAGTATHLRVIFALLCKPELLNAPYRDIVQVAGVALGTIGWVFNDLADRGFTTGQRKGDRVMLERRKLIDEWITTYPITLRPKLNPRRFKAPQPDWWKALDITQYGAQWGTEVAAANLTGYLRPNAVTIYLHKENGQHNLTRLVAENRLRPDTQGDIEILDAFWDFDDERPMAQTVPPLLAYADLAATLDPRNLEAAKLIHDQYLTPADAQA
ncbi:MAG: type IV toxin-antitoxin system AbiEi family antitoxin [Rhodocyclaceae bacterium]